MADAQHRVCFRFCRGIPRDADATGTAAVRRCTAVRGDGDNNLPPSEGGSTGIQSRVVWPDVAGCGWVWLGLAGFGWF